MRQSTSNGASEGGRASTPSTSQGPDAGSVLEPVTAWKEAAAASERWWIMMGAGLGLLACVAVGSAAVRALSGSASGTGCSDGVTCNAAGVGYTSAPEASDDDLALAARLFQRSCDLGHGPGCNNLGLAHDEGRGVPIDHERSMVAFERACSLGFAEGCSNQGALYEHGRGVATNLGDAQRLYTTACRRGSALGCSNLGVLYSKGLGVNEDETVATRLFAGACTAGSDVGCTNLLASGHPTFEPGAGAEPLGAASKASTAR